MTLEESTARLRSDGRRLGRARKRVLEVFDQHDRPLSAEDIVMLVPEAHKSSVYRSLSVLEELGLVRHVHLAHGPAMYEAASTAERTRHLVCVVCERHIAMPAAMLEPLQERVAEEYDFIIDASHFALLGHCASCREGAEDRAR